MTGRSNTPDDDTAQNLVIRRSSLYYFPDIIIGLGCASSKRAFAAVGQGIYRRRLTPIVPWPIMIAKGRVMIGFVSYAG